MNVIHKYICGILAVLLTGYFFFTKDLSNKYDKVIMAEGHGYYVYLPATFIYHDNTFDFFNVVSKKYYYPSYNPPTGNFINQFDGIRLNKYFPGVSLLWMPFFLLAHFIALLFRLPADGYSDIYQYGIGMAGIFYTWLGLKFTKKILTHFKILPAVQTITLSCLLFGTNLLLYSGAWSSQSHCYSFFLIAGFFWFVIRLLHPEYVKKNYALSMSFIFLAFIVTVRPQNAAILVLLPFLGLNKSKILSVIRENLFSGSSLAGILIACILIGRVSYYWYIQTGRFFLNPYHGEHYYFNNPHVLSVLFGYRQGWVVYSPFIGVALAGIFFFKRITEKLNFLVFWGLFLYVSSCWWCWTYGTTSYSQREFVDFYCLIAIQAAVLFNFFYERKIKIVPRAVALLTIPLCVFQTYQYRKGIIPGEYGTSETYWGNFFITYPISFYPIPKKTITDKEEYNFSFDDYLDSSGTGNTTYSGSGATFISSVHPFSERKFFRLPSFMPPGDYSVVRVTAMVKTLSKEGNEILWVDFLRDGKVISTNSFYMNYFLRNGKWTKYQCGQPVPDNVNSGDSVSVYFQKIEGRDTVYIDELKVEFIHMDKSYDFNR